MKQLIAFVKPRLLSRVAMAASGSLFGGADSAR